MCLIIENIFFTRTTNLEPQGEKAGKHLEGPGWGRAAIAFLGRWRGKGISGGWTEGEEEWRNGAAWRVKLLFDF